MSRKGLAKITPFLVFCHTNSVLEETECKQRNTVAGIIFVQSGTRKLGSWDNPAVF